MSEENDEGPQEALTMTVRTETRNLRSPPFLPPCDPMEAGKEWEEWLENIEREFRFFKLSDSVDKCDALVIYGGKDIARLAKSLPDPVGNADENLEDYDRLRTKLNDYFKPKQNKHHARYLFLKMRPKSGENTVVYAARLRERAIQCEFEDHDERILEHLIQTIENQALIRKAINKRWELSQFLTEASQIEDVSMQVKNMREKHVAFTRRDQGRGRRNSRGYFQRREETERRGQERRGQDRRGDTERRHKTDRRGNPDQSSRYPKCCYCGLNTHAPGRNCPAYGVKCAKCQRWNHYTSMCSKGQTPRHRTDNQSLGRQRKFVKKTEEDETSSEDEFFRHSAKHLEVHRVKKTGKNQQTVQVQFDDVEASVEADSGSDENIMDEHQFKAFQHRTQNEVTLTPSTFRLRAIQKKLEVKGEFKTIIRNKTCGVKARVLVVKGRIDSPPLLSRETLERLGMLEIREDGSFAQVNDLRITEKQVKQVSQLTEIEEIKTKHAKVFEGIGLIRDIKNDREIYGTFSMKPDAVPVAQKPRHVPYHLVKPLEEWLKEGEKEGLFEKVPYSEPITWCSPLVVQPKPRFAKKGQNELEPHMIRASVDLRVPNQHMDRSRITQATVVEDFMYRFQDCKIFSKLDMRMGYHQLLLDPKSREIATFSTPWGNMRPKRLIFGAKSSQDLFDETIYRIFGDIPRCLNHRDDILIGGINQMEHNRTLEAVLQRAEDFGITFNPEKCQFGVEELEFYGYLFTKNGLKPTPEKVRAVKECSPPESKTAVRSFLGMVGYLSKFIPCYAELTAPLRELTHKDIHFRWGNKEQNAFDRLKNKITDDSVIAYFDPNKPIIVRTEASFSEGISAGLFQPSERGLRPVHFISRSMTEVETRYSQTEKDALAISWAKRRFRMYLLGAQHVKIVTAHKPLIPLFNKASSKLPPRIEKWVMDMQDIDFQVVYQPGKDEADPMDYLSRHPLPEEGTDTVEKVIRSVIAAEHAVVLKDIEKETLKDAQMTKVKERIQKDDWEKYKKDENIAPFYMVRRELYVAGDVVFRMKQIVIPESLQVKVIRAAHSLGHFGITRTKSMLREKYWFPSMNKLVEDRIGRCFDCQVTVKENRQEPVKVSEIPKTPWEVVAMDFGGPYPDGHYNLVVIDKRTRYPEVEQVRSTSFEPTKMKLKKIFATYGTPRRIETDNGLPFNSQEFNNFAKEEGFVHHRITPLHPRANGEAESFMKVLNKTEKIAHLEKKNISIAVSDMLTGYRSTPHPATGVPPYLALMNRTVRTKIDHPATLISDQERERRIEEKDRQYKEVVKKAAENKNTSSHQFKIGDFVLLKQTKKTKWSTAYEPAFYTIYKIRGSTISARRMTDGREITRDASQFKCANDIVTDINTVRQIPALDEDWREKLFISTQPEEENDMELTDSQQEQENNESQTDTRIQEPHCQVQTAEIEDRVQHERPRRNRRLPNYLQDYVL